MYNLKDYYGKIIVCWSAGQTYVLGRFTGVISLVLLASTYLAVMGTKLDYWQLILLGLAMCILILSFGYTYVKLGLFKIEQATTQRQNPEIMEMKNDIKKILEQLNKR